MQERGRVGLHVFKGLQCRKEMMHVCSLFQLTLSRHIFERQGFLSSCLVRVITCCVHMTQLVKLCTPMRTRRARPLCECGRVRAGG